MNIRLLFISTLFIFLFVACNGLEQKEIIETWSAQTPLDFKEELIRTHIERKLNLQADDIGSVVLFSAHLNEDGIEDGLVVLNLSPKAKKDMENSSNSARFHDAGYIGDYNYLIIWDGETRQLGGAFKLVGNGLIPLKVELTHLLDPGYKTVRAEYRVLNTIFHTYLHNYNGSLLPVFSFTVADLIGDPNMKTYVHVLEENPNQIQKDIVIYSASWPSYEEEEAAKNKYSYPLGSLNSTGQQVYRFFFDINSGKYASNDTPPSN